jgi:prepilin-type N-terminal cleavage/methylation domain-containing protein
MLKGHRDEHGYSLLEIMVVSVILAVIMAIGGGAFVSINNSTTRNELMVQAEQSASTVLTQLEHDIRSSQTVAVPGGVEPSQGIQMAVLASDGTTTNIEWLYNISSQTLTREVQSGSSYQPSGFQATSVQSAAFTYYNAQGTDITATTNSNIATCATAIGIDLLIAPAESGTTPFEETAEVALTNQLNVLTAPGNGQCGAF